MFSWLVENTHKRISESGGAATERGAVLVEYAFLFALVVLAGIIGLALFGGAILDLYTHNNDAFTAATEVGR